MISPESDLGILLIAMGEYQDRQHAMTGDHVNPAMVRNDWEFHEQRTGFSREEICRLLPQLVAEGLAEGLGKGKGMPFGYRVSDGYAFISAVGQMQLSTWRQPPPPAPIEIAGFGPQAQLQLQALIVQAAELGITRADIDRFEEILENIADNTETDRVETAADLSQLVAFFGTAVFPLLRNVVG